MIFYGRNVALEAIRSNHRVKYLYIERNINLNSKISEILNISKSNGIAIKELERNEISKLSNSDEHQGIAVEVEYSFGNLKKALQIKSDKSKAFIYISEATYEHNIGAISRSAEVAGLDGVIIPKQAEITPVVARTSTGAIFHIPLFKESIFNVVKEFKNNQFFIFGIERDGQRYFDVDISEDSLFIIGGEDKSLSESIRSKCDEILEIPQFGKVNSLNMSVASSIILFERNRQILSAE
jgi:23S rRNA (guanosine2251-2'-O)-methyltransferase